MNVRLKDLPQEAQEVITRDLTSENVDHLVIDAIHAKTKVKRASYPTDPLVALREARDIGRRAVMIKTDDPVGLAIDTLSVASAALSRGCFDDHDANALVTLLDVARSALSDHQENRDEENERIRAILFPNSPV